MAFSRITAVAAIAALMATAVHPAQGQTRTTARGPSTATRVLVARGSGSGDAADREQGAPVRSRSGRPLTAAQLSQLIAPLGFVLKEMAGPWHVTVHDPTAAGGRISLYMERISNLYPQHENARMGLDGKAFLRIKALAPNEYYLINCAASTIYDSERRMSLRGPGGLEVVSDAGNHVAIYHSTDTGTASFTLRPFVQGYWTFSGCDVSLIPPPQTPH
jgi:hypothetical protein